MTLLLIYLPLGALIGLLAGLLGIGGGGLAVPALLWSFSHQGVAPSVRVHLAIGTSLATIVFTALSAIVAQQRLRAIDWSVTLMLAPATVMGSFASGYLAGFVPPTVLQDAFSLFLALISLQLLSNWRPAAHWMLPARPFLFVVGLAIGAVSAMIGIGGGSLTVPFLSACNIDIRRAIAVSATQTLCIAIFGASGFVLAGLHQGALPPWSIGYRKSRPVLPP